MKKLIEIKDKEIFKNENKPFNYLIEGENLHGLEILKTEYENKIDLIYIDPPYNIGSGLIYKNKYGNGHSEWLNFMMKRLEIAKELLSERGIILISIDDKEYAYLKVLCDCIFKEKNYIGTMIWESKFGRENDSKLCCKTEYILCYSKNIKKCKINKEKVEDFTSYKYEDEFVKERGRYKLYKLDDASRRYSKSSDFPIEINGEIAIPGGTIKENEKHIWVWRWSKKRVEWGIKNGFIVMKKDKNGINRVYSKVYQYCDNKGKKIIRTKPYINIINDIKTVHGTFELEQIFGEKRKFEYPKPVKLIKYLLEIFSQKDFLILDFFAGSGTTGHAVMEKNKEDGGERRFILITNNENQICETITYPRLKKVIYGIEQGNQRFLLCNYEENLKYFRIEEVENFT